MEGTPTFEPSARLLKPLLGVFVRLDEEVLRESADTQTSLQILVGRESISELELGGNQRRAETYLSNNVA